MFIRLLFFWGTYLCRREYVYHRTDNVKLKSLYSHISGEVASHRAFRLWVIVVAFTLYGLQGSAQSYSPGFSISSDGHLVWDVMTGWSNELISYTSDDDESLELIPDSISADTIALRYFYYNQFGGDLTKGEGLHLLPGFHNDSPFSNVFMPFAALMAGSEYNRFDHWDTVFYSISNYSCNGNFSISPFESFLHVDALGNPDSLYNVRTYFEGTERKQYPIEAYRMFSGNDDFLDSLKAYYLMQDGDSMQRELKYRADYDYTQDSLLKRFVMSVLPRKQALPIDSMMTQIKGVLAARDIDTWDIFNHWLNYDHSDRRVLTWLEFEYCDGKISDLYAFTDMTSVINHCSWTYEGDRVLRFVKQSSFGVNTEIQFSYLPNSKVDEISFHSFYADASNSQQDEWLSKFKMAYNDKGELVGYRQKH